MNDPYLPFGLEEVAQITTVNHWTNRRVRVVGRLTAYDPVTCRGRIAGEGEGIKSCVRVSFHSLFGDPSGECRTRLIKVGSLLQVLGEVDIFKNEPMVTAHILKDMLGLDPTAHFRAVDRIQPYLPINIKRYSE